MNKKQKNDSRLFDSIAPVYGLFFNKQKKKYKEIIDDIKGEIDFGDYKSIIDIGCGTGALCSVINDYNLIVTGIDNSQKMLDIAKNKNNNVEFLDLSILTALPFEDNSFDIAIASYVAHGLKKDERDFMYHEMSRITKHIVILHDYNKTRSLLTDIIECFEHGDYFNFIKDVNSELENIFKKVKAVDVGKKMAWYICSVK